MSEHRYSRPRSRIRVVLLEGIHDSAVEAFQARGYTNVRRESGALPPDALAEAVRDAHILGIRSRSQITAPLIRSSQRLMAIGCFCIGTDQVDLEAAAGWGVPVFNAPHSNTRSVAELVVGLAVMLLRGIFEKSTLAHAGQWKKSASGAHELRGRTLGIVGYGHIGSQLSVLAESLGMRVIYHDIRPVLALGNAQPRTTLEEVLAASDVLSLHVPDTELTRGLIGRKELAQLPRGAHVINASRGSVLDEEALAEAIRSGHIGGAAVDVFQTEPKDASQIFESPLRGLPQVILTPHIGGSTLEAQAAIGQDVAGKLTAYSDTGATTSAVNFPQLALADHEGCHRVLHIHRSEAGVLARINETLYERGADILGQHLQTQGGVGYVVTDVDAIDAKETLPALRSIPGTLRARVLY